MLGWLAAAAIPVLIHLWSRRKYREVRWAAMDFLAAAVKRQSRRLRLEQWLLLAVRMSVIALVVLAVAEPYFRRAGLAMTIGGNAHRILVIDGSYSMAYQPTDKTRFDRAKELARQIVEQSSQGDAFSLVLMASPPRAVVAAPALDRGEIIREIENLRLPQMPADLPATIEEVRRVVDVAQRENPRLGSHEVYFLTDLHRVTWMPKMSEAAAAAFLEQSTELGERASLSVIDLGQPNAENLAVVNLRAVEPLLTVQRGAQFEAGLKNFGHQPIERQPVELFVDGHRVEQKEVNIGADGAASVNFQYRFDAPGDHAIEVRASGDNLDVDNHRYLAAPVRKAIHALCIEGRPSGGRFRGAADYVAVALNPRRGEGRSVIQADVAAEGALADRNLSAYDCLFLCNVAQFTANEARTLAGYLESGGSIVFFLGDRVVADRYNRELGGAGQGRGALPRILPARIDSLVSQPQSRLDPLGYRHPIVQPFRGRGEASLLTTPVFKYFKLKLSEDTSARTVLALANGDPLVVEESIGHGRVVLVATSAESAWSALPVWPSFVPLVQEIATWCAGGRLEQRNLLAGETLEEVVPGAAGDATATVRTPDERDRNVRLEESGGRATLSFTDTSQSGLYTVRFGGADGRDETFAVNVDTTESDLDAIDAEELRSEVWPGVSFVHQTSWKDATAGGAGVPIRSQSRLHLWLLYGAVGLLLAETLLGWKMGRSGA